MKTANGFWILFLGGAFLSSAIVACNNDPLVPNHSAIFGKTDSPYSLAPQLTDVEKQQIKAGEKFKAMGVLILKHGWFPAILVSDRAIVTSLFYLAGAEKNADMAQMADSGNVHGRFLISSVNESDPSGERRVRYYPTVRYQTLGDGKYLSNIFNQGNIYDRLVLVELAKAVPRSVAKPVFIADTLPTPGSMAVAYDFVSINDQFRPWTLL